MAELFADIVGGWVWKKDFLPFFIDWLALALSCGHLSWRNAPLILLFFCRVLSWFSTGRGVDHYDVAGRCCRGDQRVAQRHHAINLSLELEVTMLTDKCQRFRIPCSDWSKTWVLCPRNCVKTYIRRGSECWIVWTIPRADLETKLCLLQMNVRSKVIRYKATLLIIINNKFINFI